MKRGFLVYLSFNNVYSFSSSLSSFFTTTFHHQLEKNQWLQNSGGSGPEFIGFGFIGFQRLVNFRVYRVFGFEKVPRIFNFFTIFWSKIFRFGKCSAIFTTNFQISVKIITFQYILVKKSLCRFFSRKN